MNDGSVTGRLARGPAPDDEPISPNGVMLEELHQLLAAARAQLTVLRESLITAVELLDRPTPG